MEPMALTVKQAAELLQISTDLMYDLANRRDFPAIRIGRTIRIDRDKLHQWMDREVMYHMDGRCAQ